MEKGLDEGKTESGQMRFPLMGTEQSSSIRLQRDCIASEVFTGTARKNHVKISNSTHIILMVILSHIHNMHNSTRNQRHRSKPQLKPTYSLSS